MNGKIFLVTIIGMTGLLYIMAERAQNNVYTTEFSYNQAMLSVDITPLANKEIYQDSKLMSKKKSQPIKRSRKYYAKNDELSSSSLVVNKTVKSPPQKATSNYNE